MLSSCLAAKELFHVPAAEDEGRSQLLSGTEIQRQVERWSGLDMATKRKDRKKSCLGKQKHDSHDKAVAAAKALEKERQETYEKFYGYACRYCKHWHVGHKSR